MRPSAPATRLALPLLALVACAPAHDPLTSAYPTEQCASCAEWNAPQEPFRIFGNTWYVGTHGLAAILVTSPDGHVLIDGGLPNSAPLIIENIRALGFDVADVRLILNSHPHYDHAGGIAALQRASGAQVAASAPSASVLEHGRPGPDDPQFEIHLDFPRVADVRALAEGEAVAVGPLSLTPHRTAGHTPGGTTWSWRSCEADDCLDLVFADSQTPVSADGFRFTGSSAAADFERGSALLERLPCDILITPHPGASSFWERRASGTGLVDRGACRRLAESARQQLARRLAAEATQPQDSRPYVIYLHGRIIEERGRRPTDPAHGIYEYDAILDSLRQAGFTVLSDQRPPGIAIDSFVNRLVHQVDSLERLGVPSRSITVVGFSRGGAIAILASSRLQDPALSFVFMGACGSWAFERPELHVTGRILSLFETSDSLGVSCAPLFERRGPGSVVREVPLSLGLGHGTFYRPRREWLGPVLAWARGQEP